MIPKMDETIGHCFRLYVELGEKRSIPKLWKHVQTLDLGVTLRQLERPSRHDARPAAAPALAPARGNR